MIVTHCGTRIAYRQRYGSQEHLKYMLAATLSSVVLIGNDCAESIITSCDNCSTPILHMSPNENDL